MSRIVKGEFWDRYLLQAAHTESSVWLAINSMSELIRQIGDDKPLSHLSARTAWKWYGQSLQDLQVTLKTKPRWSILCSITSILYMCIEGLLRNLGGAISIYTSAMQSLLPLVADTRKDPIHASVIDLFYHITVAHGLPLPHAAPLEGLPDKFSSILDARHALERLVGPAQKTVLEIEAARKHQARDWQPSQETMIERDRLLKLYSQWKSAANILQSELESNDNDDQLNWSSMYLAQLAYVIWLSAVPDGRKEMAWDNFLEEFEMMLVHGQLIVDICGGKQTLFSFETRVLKLMTLVGSRCRHPLLRRRAVGILHQGPRMENTTRAVHAVRMCQAFIAYEESGSVEGPFQEQPLSLDLPPEQNRIAWAGDKQVNNHDGSVSAFVVFGKWELNADDGWYLTQETIEL